MDSSSSVFNLQPGQSPADQGAEQHQHQQSPYMAKRLESSPSVSPDVIQDDFYLCDPCPSAVQNWTDSSPDSVLSTWGLGASQEYTLSPLFSPQKVPLSVSFFDADHHYHDFLQDTADVSCSMTTGPDTSPVKLEQLSPLEKSLEPSSFDWAYGGSFDLSYNFDPVSYYPFSGLPASPPQYETPAAAKTETKTTTSPPLSPPAFSDPSSYQGSPTIVKAEPEPEREPSRSSSSSSDSEPHENTDLPYSKLIYNALCSVPEKKLSLQGIYRWFERNTAKGKEGSKGWQNSIRHNLSMNAVSLPSPLSREKKK